MRRRRRRIEYPDELYHYGVKGMKWGVRRMRNSIRDGIKRYIAERREYRITAKKQPAWNYYWAEIRKDYRNRCKSDKRFLKAYDRYEKASRRLDDFYYSVDVVDWTKKDKARADILHGKERKAHEDLESESSRIYKESQKAVSVDVKKRYGYDPSAGDFDNFYDRRAMDKTGKDAVWRLYSE